MPCYFFAGICTFEKTTTFPSSTDWLHQSALVKILGASQTLYEDTSSLDLCVCPLPIEEVHQFLFQEFVIFLLPLVLAYGIADFLVLQLASVLCPVLSSQWHPKSAHFLSTPSQVRQKPVPQAVTQKAGMFNIHSTLLFPT